MANGPIKYEKKPQQLSDAARKNKNATTVVRQKRKAAAILNRSARVDEIKADIAKSVSEHYAEGGNKHLIGIALRQSKESAKRSISATKKRNAAKRLK